MSPDKTTFCQPDGGTLTDAEAKFSFRKYVCPSKFEENRRQIKVKYLLITLIQVMTGIFSFSGLTNFVVRFLF